MLNRSFLYLLLLVSFLLVFFLVDMIFGKHLIHLHEKAYARKQEKYKVETKHAPSGSHDKSSSHQVATSEQSKDRDHGEEVIPEVDSALDFDGRLQAYQDSVLASLEPGERRDDITVRYYRHELDGDVVSRLSELGYYVHVRAPTEGLGDLKTNSLYYGDDVDARDIQLIAQFLIRNGVELCQIRPSRYHADWKADAVEIGASREADGSDPLTMEDINAFEKVF